MLELNRWHQGQPRRIRVKAGGSEFILEIRPAQGVQLLRQNGSEKPVQLYTDFEALVEDLPQEATASRALRVIWNDILGEEGDASPFQIVEALREAFDKDGSIQASSAS